MTFKKITLFIVIFYSSLSIFGQNPFPSLPKATNQTQLNVDDYFNGPDDFSLLYATKADWVDSSAIWNIPDSTVYTFNDDNLEIEAINYEWENNAYQINERMTKEYDGEGNEILELRYNWDGTDWVVYRRFINEYNGDNFRIGQVSEAWDGNEWGNLSKFDLEYEADKLVYIQVALGILDEWVPQRAESHFFDGNKRLKSFFLDWDDNTQAWQADGQYIHLEYNDDDFTTFGETYSIANNDTLLTRQFFREYNSDNKLTLSYFEKWNADNEIFQLDSRTMYEYNNDNQEILRFYEKFENEIWEKKQRYTREYNEDMLLTRYLFENQGEGNTWKNSILTLYYYQPLTSVRYVESGQNDFLLFPNPVNDKLTIQHKSQELFAGKISIFNTKGQKMLTKEVTFNESVEINVSTLSSGIYWLQIDNDNENGTEIEKLVIEQ